MARSLAESSAEVASSKIRIGGFLSRVRVAQAHQQRQKNQLKKFYIETILN